MKNNLSTYHESAANSPNCVNTGHWSHRNWDIRLLGGWDERKYTCMCWWGWGKKKVNPLLFGGNSMDNA